VEVVVDYVEDIRPRFGCEEHPALWVTEPGGRVKPAEINAWFVVYRDALGLPNFIRWANRNKLTNLELPATRWGGPTGVIDTEARWQRASHLLHDNTLNPEDRVAGLLVLLYAQQPAVISRLTLDQIQISDDDTRIRLGHEPIVLPAPVADLVRELVGTRRGHATIAAPATTGWLFPGGQPGRPISAFQLAERLRQLGLNPAQSPLLRAVPTRHRGARRRTCTHARHSHRRRGRLATRQRRRLDYVRRRSQSPPDADDNADNRTETRHPMNVSFARPPVLRPAPTPSTKLSASQRSDHMIHTTTTGCPDD
jgi:hypothetical protein